MGKGTDGKGKKSPFGEPGRGRSRFQGFYFKGPFGSGQTLMKWVFSRDGLGRVTRRGIFDDNGASKDRDARIDTGLSCPLTLREKIGRGRDWTWDPLGLPAKVEDTLTSAQKNAIQVERDAAGDVTTGTYLFELAAQPGVTLGRPDRKAGSEPICVVGWPRSGRPLAPLSRPRNTLSLSRCEE